MVGSELEYVDIYKWKIFRQKRFVNLYSNQVLVQSERMEFWFYGEDRDKRVMYYVLVMFFYLGGVDRDGLRLMVVKVILYYLMIWYMLYRYVS